VAAQQPLHRGALHALAATVYEADLPKPRLVRGLQVLIHHRNHIAGRKAVKVDGVFDRDFYDRLVIA
jgi:hypothetical protein